MHTTYEDEIESPTTVPEADLIGTAGNHINQKLLMDMMMNDEISIPQGEKVSMGKVICCADNEHRNLIGTYDDNPILNSHLYEVEFPDGEVKEFSENILAENCMSKGRLQCLPLSIP